MVRYRYALTPLVIVAAVALLTLPWLGLIALAIFSVLALAGLAALAWAIVFVPYMLARSVIHHWQRGSGAHLPSAPLSLAERRNAA